MLNLAHISSSEVHLRYNMTQSKRAREEDTTPAPTAVEAAKMVQDMTRTDMKALLSQLLKGSADVRAAVKRKHLAMQAKPVDMKPYYTKAHAVIKKMNNMSSKALCYDGDDVLDKFCSVYNEACNMTMWTASKQFRASAEIADCLLTNAEHQVREMLDCNLDHIMDNIWTALEEMSQSERASLDVKWLEAKYNVLEFHDKEDALKNLLEDLKQ